MNFTTNRLCTGAECVAGWIDQLSSYETIKINNITYVKKTFFEGQWNNMMKRIPYYIKRAAQAHTSNLIGHGISNTAHKIMELQGWEGEELEAHDHGAPTGRKGPLFAPEAGQPSREGKEGLGFHPTRKADKNQIMAYETGNGEILYARGGEGLKKIIELDPLGKPICTGENLPWYRREMPIVLWKKR